LPILELADDLLDPLGLDVLEGGNVMMVGKLVPSFVVTVISRLLEPVVE